MFKWKRVVLMSAVTRRRLLAVKRAFELCYGHRMSSDELMFKLIACVEEAEPAVWDEYCREFDKK